MTKDYVRCICGKLYKFYSMMVGDQTMCPSCRAKLDKEYEDTWKRNK